MSEGASLSGGNLRGKPLHINLGSEGMAPNCPMQEHFELLQVILNCYK